MRWQYDLKSKLDYVLLEEIVGTAAEAFAFHSAKSKTLPAPDPENIGV